MKPIQIGASLIYFLIAGLCEIAGGYLVWLWLREGKNISYGLLGGAVLILYGIIPTFQRAHLAGFMRLTVACSSLYLCCGDGRLMA